MSPEGKRLAIHHSLIFKLIFWVGLIMLFSILLWSYFNIKYTKQKAIEDIVDEVNRLSKTIRLGTHYAMMLNSRDDINQIIQNIGRQEDIENIRIYNKEGVIKFSNVSEEIENKTNIKAEACYICHREEPPLVSLDIMERTRVFYSSQNYRLMGIISPIYNEPSCATDSCHVHPEGKKVLGALDLVVSLRETDRQIMAHKRGMIALAFLSFLGTSAIIGVFLFIYVTHPIKKLTEGTRRIGQGEYGYKVRLDRNDEIGHLAQAINEMGVEIGQTHAELNKQRDEYQNLFEMVPCYITVQDRELKLLRYNREFIEHFAPKPGDYCYKVYKGRSEKCEICPVEKTFQDGGSHYSEESGISKDGTESHWMVRTAPVRDANGEIVAVMEMNLDITQRKQLEREVKKSEEKYREIFNHIPNSVFVLDRKSLEIIDLNDSAQDIYGYPKDELLGRSFLNLFAEEERERYHSEMQSVSVINQARQFKKDDIPIFVAIRVSPSEYLGKDVLLVTTSDITKRLMAEQQLIQAAKMTTLGEMAAGIAHELNQPLTVIKSASTYIARKIKNGRELEGSVLRTMAEEIEGHVDRATKVINHLREFGRKSEVKTVEVDVNVALEKALEILSQPLKLREIEVTKDLDEKLPHIMADTNRLEQIFINLLLNARDAIEEKWAGRGPGDEAKRIALRTYSEDGIVKVEVSDNGTGISKAILDKVFEPFFTTKQVAHGTGLGLSISYSIVQEYGGTIDVETREDEGSTFIVKFPVPEQFA